MSFYNKALLDDNLPDLLPLKNPKQFRPQEFNFNLFDRLTNLIRAKNTNLDDFEIFAAQHRRKMAAALTPPSLSFLTELAETHKKHRIAHVLYLGLETALKSSSPIVEYDEESDQVKYHLNEEKHDELTCELCRFCKKEKPDVRYFPCQHCYQCFDCYNSITGKLIAKKIKIMCVICKEQAKVFVREEPI